MSVTEKQSILEVILVGFSLVFPIWLSLSTFSRPYLLHHEGNLKRDALIAEIRVMVAKRAVIPLPPGPDLGFCCNLSVVTKVMGGTSQ